MRVKTLTNVSVTLDSDSVDLLPKPSHVTMAMATTAATVSLDSISTTRPASVCLFLRTTAVFIRLETRLQPSIGNALRLVLMVFTRSGITAPKVNQFE